MRYHCSIAFLLLSAAILLLRIDRRNRVVRFLAVVIGALVAAWGVGIVAGLVGGNGALVDVGRAIPLGAGVGFLLMGVATAALASPGRAAFHVGQISALLAGATGLASIVSRVFEVPAASGWPASSGASSVFDLALILVSAAAVTLRSDRGLGLLLLGDGLGSSLARPLVAAALVLPVLVELIGDLGRVRGPYGDPAQRAVGALLVSGISAAIALLAARWVERSDQKRRAALAALADSEERLELQMRRMPIACIVWDRSFRVVSWNPAASRIFGFTEAEMVGREPYGTIVPAAFAPAAKIWKRLLEGDENAHSVNENGTKDGRTIICEWSNTPLIRDDGEVIGAVSMVADVTAKLRAEISLRESEERYRDLVESSNDLICTHDLEGRLLSVNPAVERALGIPTERLLGMRIQDGLAPECRDEFAKYMEEIIAEGQASGKMRVVDASGSPRIWEYRNTMRYRQGAPRIVRGMARDVTERCLAESALRKSEARYRMLFENGPHPSFVVDEQTTRIAAVNAAALLAFGLSEEEFLSKSVLDDDLIDETERIAEARRDPSPVRQRSNIRCRRKGGSTFSGDVVSSAIDYDGRPARLVVITDVTEREDAKRALLEVQQFDQEIISGAGQGIVVTDRDLRIVVWNPFMEQLTGVTASDAIAKPVASFPFLRNGGGESGMRETLRSGRRQTSEIEIECDRERRWLLGVYVPHRNAAGDVSGVIAIVSEITEQKRTQDELRLSRELHRNIIDSSPNFVYSYDLEGRFLSANDALCGALRMTEEEIVGKSDAEVGFPADQVLEWDDLRQRVAASGDRIAFSTSVPLLDGERHTYDVVLSPLRGASGDVIGTSGIAVDVTDRLRTADSLTRLSRAVDQSSEVIFMTDRDGRITYANPAFEVVYGYTLPETLGKTPRILKSCLHSEAEYADFWTRILRGETVRGEMVNKRKDRSLVTVERSVSPVSGADGDIIGFISVQNDVSERRKMLEEQETLRARMAEIGKMEALGTLAGGIAHDFNNILSIVLSFSRLAEKVRLDSDRFPQAIETIRQAVRRGADLAKQVLTFARRAARTVGPVDVNEIVREIETMAHRMFPKTIAVETQLDPTLPLVTGDASELYQALLNLSVNARDAMPVGGTITVITKRISGDEARMRFADAPDGWYALVEVSDTGTGMSEDVRQRIFEPFFTTKADGRGTGLGLAVTYGVVRAAGGFIDVESQIDRGSTFRLLLPLPESAAAGERTAEIGAVPAVGTETILLVEDEPAIGPFLVESLQDHGYSVLFATDGAEALQLFERNLGRVHLIVSDDGLPRVAGRDFLLEIRKRDCSIPTVLASGFVEPDALEALRRAGLSHFLQKPYEVRDLLAVVRTLLDAPAPREPELHE